MLNGYGRELGSVVERLDSLSQAVDNIQYLLASRGRPVGNHH